MIRYLSTYNPAVFVLFCGLTLLVHFVVTVLFGG